MEDHTDRFTPKEKSTLRKTTLAELGPRLPIGYEVGGKLVKEFKAIPWKVKHEKQLGKIRDESEGMSLGGFVSKMMGVLMVQIGPHAFEMLKESERDVIISQSYMADVLYMYVYLRRHALDNVVSLDAQCPNCKHKFTWSGDLDTLEILVADSPDVLTRKVELKEGVPIFGESRKSLLIRPPFWSVLEHPDAIKKGNSAERDALLIKDSIIGAEGINGDQPIAIADSDLDEVIKWDYEKLVASINESPGPNMVLDLTCERCPFSWSQMIEWQYEAFFRLSSQS